MKGASRPKYRCYYDTYFPNIYLCTRGARSAQGFEYARTQNPTRQVLEANLAALENGTDAVCFSSGLAAMDAVLKLLNPGDEVIATDDLYGGSYRIVTKVFAKYGIRFHFTNLIDLESLSSSIVIPK